MASRHSVDLHFNPSGALEELPSQYCGSSLSNYGLKGLAGTHSVNSAEKGSSRRRSFHGGELKRETAGNRKTSAAVSIVGLGCWAPSQAIRAVKQIHPPQEPSLPMATGHDSSSEMSSSMQGKAEVLPRHSSADSKVYVCPLPNSCSINNTSADAYQKSTAQHKGTHQYTHDKSRRRQQEGVREVQVAIHRLSSKLKRMDLDELLLPATSQELAAESNDAMFVAHKKRLQEISSLSLDQKYATQEEVDSSHGRDFSERKSGRVHSRHRARRRKRDHGPSNHLHLQLEEAIGHDRTVRSNDTLSQIHPAEEDIQASENEKAEARHAGFLKKENSAEVGEIELEILSSPRKGACVADISPVKSDHAMQASQIDPKLDATEISSSDERDDICDANTTKGLSVTAVPALEEVPNNVDDIERASESISGLDAAGGPASEHDLGCNGAKSPCFSELLLSSSDVVSPSSEDSSQLSEALQNLSGGQSHKVTKAEEPLTKSSNGPQGKQNTEQSAQSHCTKRRVCSKEHCFLLASLSSINSNGSFPTSGNREKAFLWIHEQDKASQRSAGNIDLTLVLKRFGNLLLSSIPCEGTDMVALEPLFHETIRIAKSFLRVFSSHMFELSKDFFAPEYLDEQSDRKLSLVHMAPLPSTLFVHQHHIKYGVQALMNEPIFDQFDEPAYCGYNRKADCWVLLVQFQRLCTLTPIDAMNPMSNCYNICFHNLCCKKFQLLKDKFSWLNEWPNHLLEAFVGAMKYVWQAHLIAQASGDAICLLQYKEWSPYDSSVMEVVNYDHDAAAFISRVQFAISPGFRLQGSVVKSEVYLIPRT